MLYTVAKDALNNAYAAAPLFSGHYRDSLMVSGRESEDKLPRAKVGSSSSFWHFVEYGSLDTQPYHTLSEAVRPLVEVYEEL
jgi:hypothetical protein